MSHQSRLALNSNGAIINTKVLSNLQQLTKTTTGEMGSAIAVDASSLAKTSLKINPSLNNEVRYAVTLNSPITSQGVKVANSAGIPALSATKSSHLIHFIPLQMGNVNTTVTPSKQQQQNDEPLAIQTKSNKIYRLNTLNENPEDVGKVVETTQSTKECIKNTLTVADVNIGTSIGASRGQVSANSATNISAVLNAVPVNHKSAAFHGTSAILVQNQSLKHTATLQRVSSVSGEGMASILNTNNDVKFESHIKGNVAFNQISLPTSTTVQISESSSKISQIEMVSSENNNGTDKALARLEQTPFTSNITSFEQTKDTTSNSHIIPYLSTHLKVSNSNVCDAKSTCNFAEVSKEITSVDAYKNDIISTDVSNTSDPEDLDRSGTMFIIDDSTDDEMPECEAVDIENPNRALLGPVAVAHISNSVVLTKANTIENRTNGSSRNLSSEPANVVLMKLPNAMKQVTGRTNPHIQIPIIEDPTLGEIPKKNPKANPEESEVISSPKKELSTILMRSNSIPGESNSISARATKRSYSLNYVQSPKFSPAPFSIARSKIVESPESSRNTSPRKTSITSPKNIDIFDETTCDGNGSPSPGELNKENNEISFIELEDSFTEDYSDESNESDSPGNSVPTLKNNAQERTETEHVLEQSLESKLKKEQYHGNTSISTSTQKDQDENGSIISPTSQSKPSPALAKNDSIPTPVAIVRNLSDKNEKEDQVIKSVLCNENITPTSSSSAPVLQDHSSVAKANISQINVRSALAPRVRDQNRIIDVNAANARRLCRDSSIASALSMVSTFDMLNWKEDRIASARGTAMRFELNEFNLLQVHERGCPPRYRIHTPYERPIYERFSTMPKTDQADPLLYLCRKCKLYGPAVDFLAPEFCSVDCLKRTLGKRGTRDADIVDIIEKKRLRKIAPVSNATKPHTILNLPKQAPIFRWSTYLSNMRNAVTAPIDLFLNPFPTGPNPFMIGMKLEAIDPENCSLFCVCTVVHIQGYRLRLNFDGYNKVYDFWVNADSMDIFPAGWCAKTNRILQPPRGYDPHKFDWPTYLKHTNSIGADKKFFTHLNSSSIANRNPFTVGMFLEADDLNDTGKLCVASVADVLDERIRVHFDGWDDCYDYWVDISSPYIHPCGWHEGRQQLLVPPEYGNTSFNWRDYIRESQGLAAPTDFFVSRDPIDYRPGMKLEVVDPRNSCLIRPATVVHRMKNRVKIHFDCWPSEYTFSLEDDSPDLHPIGWCDATGHELEPPPGFQQHQKILPCSTIGCRGLGNMVRSNGMTHANREFCPYVLENWRLKLEKTPRVEGKDIVRKFRKENSVSLLRTTKPQFNHSGNSTEFSKQVEKILNMPYKQATRGRPRNCDRLAAAAAVAAAALEKQKDQLEILQQKKEVDTIKKEPVHENVGQVKKELPALHHCKAFSTSATKSNINLTIPKRFLCDYGPRLKQNYELWCQNASFDVASKVQRNPLLWSTAETCAFIDAAMSECNKDSTRYKVSSKLYLHEIDGAALLDLQQQDLTEILQLKIGPAVKLCSIILQLRMLVVSKYRECPHQEETIDQSTETFKIDSDCPK